MGLKIALEDEFGHKLESVIDPRRLLLELINEKDLTSSCCLRFIDPYGNTVFNRSQADQFLLELDVLHASAKSAEQREIISKIEELATRCRQEPHLYIKIYGD